MSSCLHILFHLPTNSIKFLCTIIRNSITADTYQFPNNLPCFLAFFVSITCVWTILYACSFHILQDFCLQRFQCSQAVSLSFGMVIVCPGVNAIWQVSVTAMLTFYNFYICSKSCIISKFQHVFENPIVQSLTKVSLLQVMLCF